MYAKLFSRIAQSSLMEEQVTTRYVFMMMLALSDKHGDVIGTDVAIARMMNVSKSEFEAAIAPLLAPDPDSNSPAEDGRRLVPSENGRGYRVVNYGCYRDMKSDEEKREYMRNYMRERRASKKGPVNPVKKCKPMSTDVTHTEVEVDTNKKKPSSPKYDLPFDSPEFAAAWQDWLTHKKEIKYPVTALAAKKSLKKLSDWGESRSIAAIDHSIEQGWKGIYEEKKKASDPGFIRPINEPTPTRSIYEPTPFRAFD